MNTKEPKVKTQKTISAISIADEFKNTPIKDQRIVKRLINSAETLAKNPGESIPEACQSNAKTKGTYRLLSNKKVNSEAILDSHRAETIKRIKQHKVVLSIQDSTSLDYTTHPKTNGLGPIATAEKLLGLLVHTALVLNIDGTPLGILTQKVWARNPDERGKRKYRNELPIEDKESYKWLETMDKSLEGIPESTTIVTIGDREADIYELFHKATTEKKELLIRAAHDRCVDQEQKKLYAQVNSSPVLGKCMIRIPPNTELNLPPRTAWLMIQSCKVKLCPPANKSEALNKIELTAILAKEISPPDGVKPVQWLLLTTLAVETVEEAIEKVHWYCHRWKIERFHYVLKSGCKIEELQLETSDRLKNAIALYSFLAWRLTWITYQARETPNQSCALILEDHEWKILYREVNKTSRLPINPPTLQQAVILIARLGGFLARKSDGDPGVKVLWRGFRELNIISKAYLHLRSHPID